MLDSIKFSVPLWPGLNPQEIEQHVYPFLEECYPLISDLYFTSRIPPFQTDAMGGVIVPEEVSVVTNNALIISRSFDIPLSATFNNIHVSPTYSNYRLFVENFKRLYDEGVRVVTIPHTSWLRFGLKDRFPDLLIKNTILHRVSTAAEVAKLYEEGFDYINLERTLMRNEVVLKEINEAKQTMMKRLKRPLFLSLLYNEMCEGHCPVHHDHYTYNFNRTVHDAPYFASEMGHVSSCKIKNENSMLYILKAAGIPSYYSTLSRLSNYVDVFKMHGRESKRTFYETMNIITQFKRRELINDSYRPLLSRISSKDRSKYLNRIRTCKFDCWRCSLCDDIVDKYK